MTKAILPGCFRAFLILLFAFTACSFAGAQSFRITTDTYDVTRIEKALANYRDIIAAALGTSMDDTIDVFIESSITGFENAIGGAFPDWGAAVAIKGKNRIVIKSPAAFEVGKTIEELLGHELGHLMLDGAVDGKWLPRWFQEGFCQFISGEWRLASDFTMTRAVWGGGLIPLTALDHVNRFSGPKANLAYAESFQAFSMLVKKAGIEFLPEFVEHYKETNDFYRSFFLSTGYEYLEWVNLWSYNSVREYRWILFIFDPSILFPLLAVLFIVAYLVKRYQAYKKKKRWEMEEKYRSNGEGIST